MEFFNSAIEVLQTLVVALGAGLGVWGAINLLEGYGNDNPGSKSAGFKQHKSKDKSHHSTSDSSTPIYRFPSLS